MGQLSNISGREAVKRFEKVGYRRVRQAGSHIILEHSTPGYPILSIPDHKELAPGLLRSQIKRARLTVENFLGLKK